MREEVYVQAPGVSTPQRRSGEQRGCQSSTTPSRGSLERRIMLFSREERHILSQFRDKMEIPDDVLSSPTASEESVHIIGSSRSFYAQLRSSKTRTDVLSSDDSRG